uniref:Photosystem II subunit M n=1 Tax=Selaginella kraussiana TaxID=81964 RepID=A0A3Q9R3C1_9TRAC|nr:photosystem II subunit M [Selaginella kraussiana]YP_009555724.1 photosystem II subunit M [Selaginella kraussiana]AZU95815.1 photosystem II subunit M [Selaginella kraussiana]AZU95841.1 photosystem II subunit M [Selaginella kraussiana]
MVGRNNGITEEADIPAFIATAPSVLIPTASPVTPYVKTVGRIVAGEQRM